MKTKYTHIITKNCLYRGRRCRFHSPLPEYNGYRVTIDSHNGPIEYHMWRGDVRELTPDERAYV